MFQQKKPYSAVTVSIENLTSESHDEDDFSGIPELVEVIKLQSTGPTEAARAIRKKLKYGNVHRQIRALVILDGLIQNAGPRFQRAFLDEPLLERLRVCGSSDLSDPDVRNKCRELFRGWTQYAGTPGLEQLSRLHKELPKRKAVVTQERSKVVQETENPFGDDEEEEARAAQQAAAERIPDSFNRTSTGSSSFFGSSSKDKKKDKKSRRKSASLEQEREQMRGIIGDSGTNVKGLLDAMQNVNRERERISDNAQAVQQFEACKKLRRRVLRYIHQVDDEEWLGRLLNANDQLVHALMSFEQMDRSIDADSDSDDEIAEQAHLYRMIAAKGKAAQANSPTSHGGPDIGGLSLDDSAPPPPKPPRPMARRQPESAPGSEDEDDPFGDSNVIETPAYERGEPKW